MSLALDGTTGISASGNITGGNVIASGSLIVGAFTPTSVSASGNVTGGNILTVGLISATGNVTGAYLLGNAALVTGLSASSLTNGTSNVVVASGSNITFAVGGANIINVNSNGINNMLGNGIGNIGSATTYFDTVFAKATSAQYADLAEMYCADAEYTPGTVLEFGGTEEVTITTQSHSTQAAGIVSTNPSYLMNSTLTCVNAVQVALVGRVPCSVVGTIRKGDRLVSSDRPGVAQALNTNLYQPGCIVGKALEEYNSTEPGVIEVAVGKT
jgi:hypothetical protein